MFSMGIWANITHNPLHYDRKSLPSFPPLLVVHIFYTDIHYFYNVVEAYELGYSLV